MWRAKLGPQYAHIAFQLFRAASGIGSNLEEGEVWKSRRDKAARHAISLRESRGSRCWLRLVVADGTMVEVARPLLDEAEQFVAMLTASVRKLRNKSDDEE